MDNISANNKSREKLSKECFEALFQFSVLPNGLFDCCKFDFKFV